MQFEKVMQPILGVLQLFILKILIFLDQDFVLEEKCNATLQLANCILIKLLTVRKSLVFACVLKKLIEALSVGCINGGVNMKVSYLLLYLISFRTLSFPTLSIHIQLSLSTVIHAIVTQYIYTYLDKTFSSCSIQNLLAIHYNTLLLFHCFLCTIILQIL